MEVTVNGEVMYSFADNWQSILHQKFALRRLAIIYERVYPILSTGLKSLFGIVLIASIAFIYLSLSSLNGNSDDEGSGSKSKSSVDIRFLQSAVDYWFSYSGRQAQSNNGTNLSLLLAIFSYLFGDGDPNKGKIFHSQLTLL